jgi:hypothetical protein
MYHFIAGVQLRSANDEPFIGVGFGKSDVVGATRSGKLCFFDIEKPRSQEVKKPRLPKKFRLSGVKLG